MMNGEASHLEALASTRGASEDGADHDVAIIVESLKGTASASTVKKVGAVVLFEHWRIAECRRDGGVCARDNSAVDCRQRFCTRDLSLQA